MEAALDFLFKRLAVFLAAASLATALAVMGGQVVFRYLFNDSLIWAEEAARYALIWSSMIGAAVAYRQGAHVAITDLVKRLPAGLQGALARLVHLLVLGFSGLLVWHGWALALRNFARHQLSTALQVDIAWIQLAIPVGGVLMMVAALEAVATGKKPSAGVSSV